MILARSMTGSLNNKDEDVRINEYKIKSVMSLSAPDRYSHFIKVAADRRSVWSLWSDGWGLRQIDDDGTIVFPIWPEKIYAELSAIGDWEGFEAREIDLDDILDELIPKLIKDGYGITVFPIPGVGGIVIELYSLDNDIRKELNNIE